jgi:Tfp pilus assembly protein PilO
VTLSDRDRKIILLLVPLAILAAYWFLLLAPKREESTTLGDQLTQAQTERDTAMQRVTGLETAKKHFASDYATVIRLGKSIPTNVDMPSLLVQLDRAAQGTGISFASIKAGERTSSSSAAGSTPPGGSATPANPASGPGQDAKAATDAVNNANNSSSASQAAAGAAPGAGSGAVPGLETIPLDFEFNGSYFDLADFFHRMKRFVHVTNDRIVVRGRLMTVNSFDFEGGETFPQVKATVHATVYLAPKSEGAAAGATSQGPAGGAAPATGQTASSSITPPAATVTAR